MSATNDLERKTGRVTRVGAEFGFVRCDELGGQDIYFKTSWFRGAPPLQVNEEVSFLLKVYGANRQATYIDRVTQPTGTPQIHPASTRLFDWAYVGYLPDTITQLKTLALDERWEFSNEAASSEYPFPILFSYFVQTFGRLVTEGKVEINPDHSLAAFNTGLVDNRYEPIHALFERQYHPRVAWKLAGFSIAGEGRIGQDLVRHFNPLPRQAHYFDDPADLLYDVRAGKPEMPWNHIVVERISRWPQEFIASHCPPRFEIRNTAPMSPDERKSYFFSLGEAIRNHPPTYRDYNNRLKDALDLSIKRISWNFKTAIPQYYPRQKTLTLLLPLCLVSDDRVDLALAVEKTPSGNYLGHTVLTLDWAYKNARLICRPDSDWLVPDEIAEATLDEADEG